MTWAPLVAKAKGAFEYLEKRLTDDCDNPYKMAEELEELRVEVEAGDRTRAREEFGDLAFALVALSRHLGVDAEIALREANTKFERRFRAMEELSEGPLTEHDSAGLERLWEQVKQGPAGGSDDSG